KQHNAAARTTLTEARKQFASAEQTLKSRLDALPPPEQRPAARGRTTQRDIVEVAWLEARYLGGLCCLFTAQAIEGAKDKDRLQLLKDAGDALDKLFQEFRGKRLGSLAHLWQGLVY